MITAYFDGGSRGNPGPAGWGAYLIDADGTVIVNVNKPRVESYAVKTMIALRRRQCVIDIDRGDQPVLDLEATDRHRSITQNDPRSAK